MWKDRHQFCGQFAETQALWYFFSTTKEKCFTKFTSITKKFSSYHYFFGPLFQQHYQYIWISELCSKLCSVLFFKFKPILESCYCYQFSNLVPSWKNILKQKWTPMKSVGLSFCQQAGANCDQQKHVAEWILILKSGSFLVNLLRNVCDFTAVHNSAQQCTVHYHYLCKCLKNVDGYQNLSKVMDLLAGTSSNHFIMQKKTSNFLAVFGLIFLYITILRHLSLKWWRKRKPTLCA